MASMLEYFSEWPRLVNGEEKELLGVFHFRLIVVVDVALEPSWWVCWSIFLFLLTMHPRSGHVLY